MYANENTAPPQRWGNGRIHGLGYTVICSTLYVVRRETLHAVCCGINANRTIVAVVGEFSVSEAECSGQDIEFDGRSVIWGSIDRVPGKCELDRGVFRAAVGWIMGDMGRIMGLFGIWIRWVVGIRYQTS